MLKLSPRFHSFILSLSHTLPVKVCSTATPKILQSTPVKLGQPLGGGEARMVLTTNQLVPVDYLLYSTVPVGHLPIGINTEVFEKSIHCECDSLESGWVTGKRFR